MAFNLIRNSSPGNNLSVPVRRIVHVRYGRAVDSATRPMCLGTPSGTDRDHERIRHTTVRIPAKLLLEVGHAALNRDTRSRTQSLGA